MSLILLEPAQQELDETIAWYTTQVAGLGDAFLLEALRTFNLIERYPDTWHPIDGNLRRCRLARFPYGVIYASEQDALVVLAIAHLHRRPDYWRDRLRKP